VPGDADQTPDVSLEEFVREALLSLVRAVRSAQLQTEASADAHGVPAWIAGFATRNFHEVDFDVAVEVRAASGGKRGWNVEVAGVGMGRGASDGDSTARTTRLRFKVPIYFQESPGRKHAKD
jgi:hypothetical protein